MVIITSIRRISIEKRYIDLYIYIGGVCKLGKGEIELYTLLVLVEASIEEKNIRYIYRDRWGMGKLDKGADKHIIDRYISIYMRWSWERRIEGTSVWGTM